MDNVPIEKENSERVDFNERLKSFEDMFLDTNIIPNSRYRLVENTEEAKPGYCNGILNEYEVETLHRALSFVNLESNLEPLDLSVNTETIYKKDIENLKFKGIPSKQLLFSIGDTTFRSKTEVEVQSLLLTIMEIVERRVKNTFFIEFRIV